MCCKLTAYSNVQGARLSAFFIWLIGCWLVQNGSILASHKWIHKFRDDKGWPEPYIYGAYTVLGREIAKYTVIYSVCIRFWPTLGMMCDASVQA
jgi:hypothetical protein